MIISVGCRARVDSNVLTMSRPLVCDEFIANEPTATVSERAEGDLETFTNVQRYGSCLPSPCNANVVSLYSILRE